MTLHQSLLADLIAKDHPEPEEFFRVAEALEELGRLATFEKFDYPEAAEKMRKRIGEK